MIDKAKYYNLISKTYYKKMGRVSKVIGLTVESIGPDAKLNDGDAMRLAAGHQHH